MIIRDPGDHQMLKFFGNASVISIRESFVSAKVSLGSQQSMVSFISEYRVKFLGCNRLVFILFLPTFYGELVTIIETVWMRVFPCDNPRSGVLLMVNVNICATNVLY